MAVTQYLELTEMVEKVARAESLCKRMREELSVLAQMRSMMIADDKAPSDVWADLEANFLKTLNEIKEDLDEWIGSDIWHVTLEASYKAYPKSITGIDVVADNGVADKAELQCVPDLSANWLFAGFVAGDIIEIVNATNPANNGTYTVDAVLNSGNDLRLTTVLPGGDTSADKKIRVLLRERTV